jgi:hypothetical protein
MIQRRIPVGRSRPHLPSVAISRPPSNIPVSGILDYREFAAKQLTYITLPV